jgi:uncharacterized protein (TIGR04562 family)
MEEDHRTPRERLVKRWAFNWPLMGVLVGGDSAIDLPQLYVKNREEALNFLANYGFDQNDPADRRAVHATIAEAITFIERQLMPSEWAKGVQPPKEILECTDATELLLWASSRDHNLKNYRDWACAILRVMHTIAHFQGVQLKADLEVARAQIMGRFEKFLFYDKQGVLHLGEERDSVELEQVEWKYGKTRESIILKLLHKPGNVAETIYDVLGIRIVTKRKSDVMMVVKLLRTHFLVTFPNIIPKRSRNTIMGIDQFKRHVGRLRKALKDGQISPEEFIDRIERDFDVSDGEIQNSNPHSSTTYRSIQLTCRQLIRYHDPRLEWQGKLESYLSGLDEASIKRHHHLLNQVVRFSKNWQAQRSGEEVAVFYPYEIQILDRESKLEVEHGQASHDRYKKSQVRTARKRILSEILGLK